jgi:phosphonate transport system permease protein
MSLVGTSLAFVFALVLAFPATKGMVDNGTVYLGVRALLSLLRATPAIVIGIIAVAAVGFGPTAGIIGIWVHTTGVLGKYLSETYEGTDREPLDAALVDGAGRWTSYIYVLVPMEANAAISYLMYYYESNFRAATILGIVGAGGIGIELTTSIGLFQHSRTGMVITMIVGTALAIDLVSRLIRSKYLE